MLIVSIANVSINEHMPFSNSEQMDKSLQLSLKWQSTL